MQNDIDKLFDEGVSFYEEGKLDEAKEKFMEALQHEPDSEEIKYNLALVYLEKKEYAIADFYISQIREINCDEIIDELEKVNFDFSAADAPGDFHRELEEFINQIANEYNELLTDEYLPESVNCEFCGKQLNLSEIERQNKQYKCPECKSEYNLRKKIMNIENEFLEKPDMELFEILLEAQNFKIEYLYAAKKEIHKRNIDLKENEEFRNKLKMYIKYD